MSRARALLLLALPVLAMGTVAFSHRWHWYMADGGRSCAQLADRGYVFTGWTQTGSSSFGAAVVRTDSLGDTLSVRHILGLDADGGLSCRLSDDGYAVLARAGAKVLVRKFSAAGDSVWNYVSEWGGPVSAIIATFDGGCLVAGRIPDTAHDMGAIKLAADGREQWKRYYDEPRTFDSWARGAAQTRDSGFILCGDANDYVSTNLRLVRLTSQGDTVWTRLYNGPVGPVLTDAKEMPDRGFLAAGLEFDTLGAQNALYLLRTDSLGTLEWTRSLPRSGAATAAAALCATRDSGYAVAGTVDWYDSARVWLVKLDANADTLWTQILPGRGRETGSGIQQTADGGYAVAGASDSAGGSVLAIKTDSNGLGGVEEMRILPVAEPMLAVLPSPCNGSASVRCFAPGGSLARLVLLDVSGRRLATVRGGRDSVPAQFRPADYGLEPGVYIIQFQNPGRTWTGKLVVN
jgi:hypothetical protein